jgi:hypothetical protein
MSIVVKVFNDLFVGAAQVIESSFLNLSLVAAPLVPASFFGFSVGVAFYAITDIVWGSVGIGIAMAFAVESSGYLTMSNSIRNYEQYKNGNTTANKVWFSIALSIAYLLVGISSLIIIDTMGYGNTIITILGIFSFLIAAIVYVSQADNLLARHNERKELRQQKNRRDDSNELKKLRLQLQHEEKLAAIKAASDNGNAIAQEDRMSAIYPNKNIAMKIILHLRDNPDAVDNKTQMAKDCNVSRPTLNKYLDLIEQYGDT